MISRQALAGEGLSAHGVHAAPSARSFRPCPEAVDAALLQRPRRLLGEDANRVDERAEARVLGVPLDEAFVDLLEDDGDLEEREHVIEENRRGIAAAAPRIALDELRARHAAWQQL